MMMNSVLIGVQIASQIMPFGDGIVMGQWGACEKAVYDALK